MKLNVEKICNNPACAESLAEGNFHQAIVDAAYSHYQLPENEDWGDCENVLNAELVYGEMATLLILLGNYNYQVTNGGHDQYLDNGYAGENNEQLMRMIVLLKKFNFTVLEHGLELLKILQELKNRADRNKRDRYGREFNDHDIPNFDDLDTRYSAFCEKWMDAVNARIKQCFEQPQEAVQ